MIRRALELFASLLLMFIWLVGVTFLARLCGNPWVVAVAFLVALPFSILAFPLTAYISDVYCGGDKRT